MLAPRDPQLSDSSVFEALYCFQAEQLASPDREASQSGLRYALVRLMEIVVALAVLILTSPIILAVAIIIWLDSGSPVLFRQKRVGKGGQLFTFYKFRTLQADAREKFPELYAYKYNPDEIAGLQFKNENDPRVTRAGRWLRRITVDELPNFINVLKGDVALVGPRAEIPEMVQYYAPEHMVKFTVRPGITGLAQIRGRGRLKFYETNAYDVEYVKTRGFWLDLKILLDTVRKVSRLDGAF